jgi:type IV pilus assembly protein PilO
MTNLQQAADREGQAQQRRLLLGVPIAVGGVLAALVFGVAVVPQWLSLRESRARLDQAEDLQQRLPLLRSQLAKTSQDQEQAERRRQRILALIQGSGEFSTFLAQLDREARRNQVQLDLFEPVAAPAPAAEGETPEGEAPSGSAEGADPQAKPEPKPLEEAGLSSERVLLSAQGRYPNLLAFMRAVERLSLLVVPSNFAIALVEVPPPPGAPDPPANAPRPTVPQLKLQLTYYTSRPENAAAAKEATSGDSPADSQSRPAT